MKTSTDPSLRRFSLSGATMGTRYSAVFFGHPDLDVGPLSDELLGAVTEVDNQMSTWKPTSDLSRLNAAPDGVWVAVPLRLFTVIETALAIERRSDGAFDIGVGDLVNAWGFGAAGPTPDGDAIRTLVRVRRKTARECLDLDRARLRIRKRHPVTLDLSGIAKGYGVDRLAECLDAAGITSYLVGIDGEMRAKGVKDDGRLWAVAVEKPDRDQRAVLGVIDLADRAVATSGDYRHYVEAGGAMLSHTMNPKTGGPLQNTVASATVLAGSCMEADALATVLMVMGPDKGLQFAREQQIEALFVLRTPDGFQQILVGAPDTAQAT